jgi:hypothetical protein
MTNRGSRRSSQEVCPWNGLKFVSITAERFSLTCLFGGGYWNHRGAVGTRRTTGTAARSGLQGPELEVAKMTQVAKMAMNGALIGIVVTMLHPSVPVAAQGPPPVIGYCWSCMPDYLCVQQNGETGWMDCESQWEEPTGCWSFEDPCTPSGGGVGILREGRWHFALRVGQDGVAYFALPISSSVVVRSENGSATQQPVLGLARRCPEVVAGRRYSPAEVIQILARTRTIEFSSRTGLEK